MTAMSTFSNILNLCMYREIVFFAITVNKSSLLEHKNSLFLPTRLLSIANLGCIHYSRYTSLLVVPTVLYVLVTSRSHSYFSRRTTLIDYYYYILCNIILTLFLTLFFQIYIYICQFGSCRSRHQSN